MFLGSFTLIVLGIQLGWSMKHPRLYELSLADSSQDCEEPQDHLSTEGCFISDLDDVYNHQCWVTSHDSCDTRRYVGEGSVCRHAVSGTAKRCLDGEWKTEDIQPRRSRRVRRWFSGLTICIGCPDEEEERHNDPPSITCPSDVTKYATSGQTGAYVTYPQPSASDDQGSPSVDRVQGPSSGSYFNEGSTVLRYRATDSEGATSECHFSVTVRVHYCRPPPRFVHGSRRCTGTKANIAGSSCSHTCDTGYTLQGHSAVSCVVNHYTPSWNTSFPTCVAVSCGNPGNVAGARVTCPSGVTFNKTCHVVCNAGYAHTGNKFITCNSSGQWTQLSPCHDVQAPKFPQGCPVSKTVFSGPLRAPTTLTWDDPVATDNSGDRVTLTSDPAKGSRLGPGTHSVTFTATDKAGNSATCSFSIDVQVRECQPLAAPANGKVTCTADHVEGSVCNISCNHGYRLKGKETLSCLRTEEWSAKAPVCKAVICPAPPSVDRGQFACPDGRQNPAVCTLTCDAGYEVRGHTTIQCDLEGNWTTPGTCEDVEPPVFDNGCHDNIEVYAAPLGQQTFVNLTAPTASDNSGDVIQVTSDVTSGSAFPIGTTVVTYEASDVSGNRNSCYVNVTVTALQCETPNLQPSNATEHNPMQESCPDGFVHGARCTLNCTHGYRLQGRDTITCARDDRTHPPTMRWEWSGTDAVKPQCKEDKCPPLPPPKNGALSCYHGDQGWECFMSCKASWDVPAAAESRFVCPNEWRFWSPTSVPDCVARTRPGRVRMLAKVLYFSGSCDVITEQLRHTFISRINQTILGGACSLTPTCVAENIEVMCTPVDSRRPNNVDTDDAVRTRLHRTRRDVSEMTSHAVYVTFHVSMPYEEDPHSPEEAYKKYEDEANNLMGRLRSRARSGFFDMDDLDLVTDDTSLGDPVLQADCAPGTVYKVKQPQTRFSCVPE